MSTSFEILPAIDIKDGRCVRLRQGRAEDARVYSEDPVAMARHWEQEGARYLHVVDLDGAFQGRPVHVELIGRIVAALSIPVEVGGGLRTDEDIRRVLETGADRVILGTRACEQPEEVARLAQRHGAHLAVGIDARNGWVQVKGWVETTGMQALELVRRLTPTGIATLIYTDTATDGMLTGPNLEGLCAVASHTTCHIIASGGITTVGDIQNVCRLGLPNVTGAIVGKALYEGRVTLRQLREAAAGIAGTG